MKFIEDYSVMTRRFIQISWMLFFLLLEGNSLMGQAFPQSALWFTDGYRLNPARGGALDYWTASIDSRSQWNAIKGAPFNISLNIHGAFSPYNGGGVSLFQESLGLEKRNFIKAGYYHSLSTALGKWTLGLAAGLSSWTIDGRRIRTPDGIYGTGVEHRDDILPAVSITKYSPYFQAGMEFHSVIGLFGTSFESISLNGWSLEQNGSYKPRATLNVYWEDRYTIYNSMRMYSYIRYYTDGIEHQTEILQGINIWDNIFTGVSLRLNGLSAIEGIAWSSGVKLGNGFLLYFAFDQSFGITGKRWRNSSNEMSLVYTWGHGMFKNKRPRIIYNPVYL